MSTDVDLYRVNTRTPLEDWRLRLDDDHPWRALDVDSEDLGALLDAVEKNPASLTTPAEYRDHVASVGNVTWNVSRMFTRAFGLEEKDARAPWALPENDRGGSALYHLHGATVADTIDGIRAALARAIELSDADGFDDLQPSNGWGSDECVHRILGGMVRVAETVAEPSDVWSIT